MNDERGWVKLWRCLIDHEVWLGEPFTIGQAWVDLLMLANFAPSRVLRGHRWIDVDRGQVFTSMVALSQRWKRDRKTTLRWLLLLEKAEMLTVERVKGGDIGFTRLTVRNYEKYQGPPSSDGTRQGTSDGTSDGTLDGTLDGTYQKKLEEDSKKGRRGRAGARRPLRPSVPSGKQSRKHVDAAWGRT